MPMPMQRNRISGTEIKRSHRSRLSIKSAPHMWPLIFPIAIMVFIVTTIFLSGVWVYDTSKSTFQLQRDIALAQNTRDRIVRVHLASRSDVQAFAATDNVLFFDKYRRHAPSFLAYTAKLKRELLRIDAHFDMSPIEAEEANFAVWQHTVADPIFHHAAIPVKTLLSVDDPNFSKAFLGDDAKIQTFLDAKISIAETHRQELLRHIIVARMVFVIAGLIFIGSLLFARERTERRRLLHAAESDEQRRIADMLQRSLAPDALPEPSGATLQAVYVPAASESSVGGDWYEVIELAPDRLLCIIGDVAGHGLDAAILMNRARQSIVAAAITEANPAKILEKANRTLINTYGCMVTVLCCVVDMKTLRLTYASAGHPPPLIVPGTGEAFILPYGGPPLGIFSDLQLQCEISVLEPGSTVFLFTDGLVEDARNIISGELHLIRHASSSAATRQPASTLFHEMIASGEPKDDVAILAITLT